MVYVRFVELPLFSCNSAVASDVEPKDGAEGSELSEKIREMDGFAKC